jgi:hypothetical protein
MTSHIEPTPSVSQDEIDVDGASPVDKDRRGCAPARVLGQVCGCVRARIISLIAFGSFRESLHSHAMSRAVSG